MTARGIGRAGVAAIALLAGALLLLPENAEASQCSRSERVDHRNSGCLYAWWKNRGLLKKSPFQVRNQCSEYGKVVAKVDLAWASDRTLHLNNDLPRDGDTRHRIRSISCCSDISDLCNRSDVVTEEGCLARFRQSPASKKCWNASASAAISGDDYSCNVSADCEFFDWGMQRRQRHTNITVPWLELDDVNNCSGRLTRGMCEADWVWLSVDDVIGQEAEGATLDFTVTLNQPIPETVTVRYATVELGGYGAAQAGLDYTSTSGTLTFAPGQTSRIVSVPVLDDDLDESWESFHFVLSNPRPFWAVLYAPKAWGRIANTDPMPKAWIGRFGRTVADQVLDAVDARMQAKPAPGVEAHVAGQRIGPVPAFAASPQGDPMSGEAEASGLGQPMSGRALLPGSSFSLTAETDGEGLISVWGRGAATGFSSREDDVSFDGEVVSGLLGADWTRGDWTAGLAVSHSRGDGAYRGAGGDTVSATLTGLWPWVGHSLSERLSLWGVAGYGDGSLTLEPRAEDGTRAESIRTHLDLMMAAAGLRGVALDGGDDGVSLAVKTDAMIVRTASDAVSGTGGNLAAAEAGVTRLRLGLEGSRPFPLAGGSVLTPGMEIGLRRDGGDAETGLGADIGAGLAWHDAERGLAAELRGRGLLAHEAESFRERGLSASFAWNPVEGDRGPQLSLTQTLGGSSSGGADALLGRATLAGPAANDNGDELQQQRLEARFGYGLAALGGRFTATPEIAVGLSDTGRDYSLGWRLTRGTRAPDARALTLALEVLRRETATNRNIPPEHAIGLRLTSHY